MQIDSSTLERSTGQERYAQKLQSRPSRTPRLAPHISLDTACYGCSLGSMCGRRGSLRCYCPASATSRLVSTVLGWPCESELSRLRLCYLPGFTMLGWAISLGSPMSHIPRLAMLGCDNSLGGLFLDELSPWLQHLRLKYLLLIRFTMLGRAISLGLSCQSETSPSVRRDRVNCRPGFTTSSWTFSTGSPCQPALSRWVHHGLNKLAGFPTRSWVFSLSSSCRAELFPCIHHVSLI